MLKRINSPFRVSVIYALVGIMWILLSDQILIILVQDVQVLGIYQTYKGWFYVIFTSLLLFGLVSNLVIRIQTGEERISTLSETLPIGLFQVTLEGKIQDVNLFMVEILAYPNKETLLTKAPRDLYVDPADREQMIAILQEEGSIRNFLTRFYKYDGEIIWLEGNMSLTQDSYGMPCYEGGFIDATARKQAEVSLKESIMRSRVFFEESPLLNWHFEIYPPMPVDLPIEEQIDWILYKSVLIEFNMSQAILRGDPSDVLGTSLYHNWGENEVFGVDTIREFADNNYSLRMYETQEYTIEGELTWSIINSFGIVDNNQLTEIWGTTLDISDRKHSENELQESEERYRTLFESTTDVLFLMKDTRIIDCNPAVSTVFGFSMDEMVGKHPGEISPFRQPDGLGSYEKAERIFKEVLEGSPQLFEWAHQRKDGSIFTAEVFLHKIIIRGDDYNMAIVRDISERKKAEEAALEERQRLAHELHDAVSQTLFSSSTIAQTLVRIWENKPELVRENLRELQILNQGALAEMRTLLLELRPSALKHTSMADLLQQLVDGFAGRTKTGIDLEIIGEHPLSFDVRFALFRIAQEALNNIIKHARANQASVFYDSQSHQINLTIKDDGRGYDQSKIISGHHGLEIMRERAETIHAMISIESGVGKGTTISISWNTGEIT